jgi:hypothetical protein
MSHSMHTLHRACSTATGLFSLTMKAFSWLVSSLSYTRSCSYISTTITGMTSTSGGGALNPPVGRDQHYDEGASLGKQQRRVGTQTNNGDARRRPSSLGKMAVGSHHGGRSRHKDVRHDLHHQLSWATRCGMKFQDYQQGKAVSISTR